ncbi:hypothetical protein G1K63_03730 [Tenacibaculum finnmarkense]|uniref:primase-helicase family protein n=1 Tax=Tenacibaculum finnmarkense TaxID=2781243 RepID=UPI001E334237|nr:primase-helicase family protein [Tenacibaculum finnmarkense]MCD8428634.1 DUF5906 domain-containing protein [Tenacibaculum finnmarkense genomovar ulcerans]MCG8722638.1 hypothetical protein [Tenacibaculum finnmarkense]
MKSETPYIRIGTSYFKIVQVPTINSDFNETLIRWDKNTIIQDHNRDYLSSIPKYDGSICFPNHIKFSKTVHGFYNTYSPLKYKEQKGKIENTLKFFRHIFEEQYELGLDYFKLLYEIPQQALPVLCLVSKERSTGKSSFLKYLKEVFGHNMSYLDSHSLNSNFNLDWGNKLILGLDEAFFQKEEITEKIKYLSTSNKNKIEAKGKERFEVDFFGKFIMCSNKEDSFIKIDADEIRFWIIKVPKIKVEDVDFLSKLINEIPAFLHFVQNRSFATEKKTRMWFTPKQIFTPALKKLVNNNRNKIENEIAQILISVLEKFDLNSVNFVPFDLLNALNRTRVKSDLTQIRHILKKDWKLSNKKNSLSYQKFTVLSDGDIVLNDSKGRYFSIDKLFLVKNFDELMNSD